MEDMAQSFCESYLSDYPPLHSGETYESRLTNVMQRLGKFMNPEHCSVLDLQLRRPETDQYDIACLVGAGSFIMYNIRNPTTNEALYEELVFRRKYVYKPRPFVATGKGFPQLEIVPMERIHEEAAERDFFEYDDLLRFGGCFDGHLYTLQYRREMYRWQRLGPARLLCVSDSNFWTKELCTLDEEGLLTIWRKNGRDVFLKQKLKCTEDVRFMALKLYRHLILVHCYLDAGGYRGVLVIKRDDTKRTIVEHAMITCHNDQILSFGASEQPAEDESVVIVGTRRGWVLYVDIETCQTHQQHLLRDGLSAEYMIVRGTKAFVITGVDRRLISMITRRCDTVELIEMQSAVVGMDARHGMMAFICQDGSTYLTMIGHWNLFKLKPISPELGPFGRYKHVQQPDHIVTVRDWSVTFQLPSGSVRCVQVKR